MKKSLKKSKTNSGDKYNNNSWMTMWLYLMPLNCTLKNGCNGKFHVFDHKIITIIITANICVLPVPSASCELSSCLIFKATLWGDTGIIFCWRKPKDHKDKITFPRANKVTFPSRFSQNEYVIKAYWTQVFLI